MRPESTSASIRIRALPPIRGTVTSTSPSPIGVAAPEKNSVAHSGCMAGSARSDTTSANRFRHKGCHDFDQALLAALGDRLSVNLTSAQPLLFAELPLKGARQSELARALGVSRQAINELVGALQRLGLVEVVPDPESGRSKLIRPTERGRDSIRVARNVFAELETELRHRIGSRTVDQLRNGLDAEWGTPRQP